MLSLWSQTLCTEALLPSYIKKGAMFVGVVEYLQGHFTKESDHNIQKYFSEPIILNTLIVTPEYKLTERKSLNIENNYLRQNILHMAVPEM